MAERPDYDALAQDINLEEITSCERNANILRKIRDGHPDWSQQLYIMDGDEYEDGDIDNFLINEGDDLGWLGYFVGQCEVLEELCIYYLPERGDEINRFFDGMNQNRSLKTLNIFDEIGVDCWSRLGSFLESNRNLSHFEVEGPTIGQERAQALALSFGRMQHSSLKHLIIYGAGIGDEGLTEIVSALGSQPQLEHLGFGNNNNIGMDSCIALGNTLSRWPVSNKLETLCLPNNGIHDGGLQALAEGLMNCRSLKNLYLGGNRSITAAGLISLSPLLQSESHCLETLHLCRIDFGDDGAIALAEGLRGNTSLRELRFRPSTAGMTSVGWSAFSKLLCDTSTINNTYLSNHTLTMVGYFDGRDTPEDIVRLLTMNTYHRAAICKILQSHPDLNMKPFFKLNMQFLPAVTSWFERLEPIEGALVTLGFIEDSERSCKSRKLSALYKFVRGMPDLTIIGYWEGRMIHIEAQKRRLVDEIRRLEYEEDMTRERLGMSGQPMDEAIASRNKRMKLELE